MVFGQVKGALNYQGGRLLEKIQLPHLAGLKSSAHMHIATSAVLFSVCPITAAFPGHVH